MIKNYFRIAWRHLQKNRAYSIINIAGLGSGMAIALLIGLWISDELSFDSYHSNHHEIAQVMLLQAPAKEKEVYTGDVVAAPLGQALHGYTNLFKKVAQVSFDFPLIVATGDKMLSTRAMWAQHEFPEIFTYRMIYGSVSALKDPSTIMLSQSLALALFGKIDPVGKIVRVDNELSLKIGGVYKNLPVNTTFHQVELLLPWGHKNNEYLQMNTNWDDHNEHIYVQLADHVSARQATDRVRKLPTPHITEWREETMIYPLDKKHLYDEFKYGEPVGGRIRFIWLFGIIGAFVLLLACINFMNLSTAQSEKRAKEVGIRKTVGSLRGQLIGQFLGESVLTSFLALLLALILVVLSLPFFNHLTVKEMSVPWTSPLFLAMIFVFALFTGILAGSYPAFYLSGFKAIRVLKGVFRAGRSASLPRQVLVVIQFSVSLILIIGTMVVFRQIQFSKDRPVGYSRDGLITVNINTDDLDKNAKVVCTELLQNGAVASVAESSHSTTQFGNNNNLYWEGKDSSVMQFFRNVNVTPEFGQTIGWHIVQGRDFSHSFATDSSAVVLNEATAKAIGWKDPIGKTVTMFGKRRTVIGVVQDMVTNSPYEKVEPAIFLGDGYLGVITIRLRPGQSTQGALARIESIFKKYNPGSPFIYQFNDEVYAGKFEAEQRIGDLATVFAGLAIFISCLGLFGLAAFVAEQRTKEIGVRKILGAGVFSLWGLLSKEFLKLVVISMLISIPLAYIAMYQWLQNYEYRAALSWWIFTMAAMGILLITLLTVSYQALKAATANPVKSLRSE